VVVERKEREKLPKAVVVSDEDHGFQREWAQSERFWWLARGDKTTGLPI